MGWLEGGSLSQDKSGSRQHLLRTLLGSALGVAFLLLSRLPVISGPLFGDDYLFVNEISGPNDAVSTWKLLFWSGSEKWRPLSTLPLGILARHIGYSYFPYLLINLAALGLLIFLVAEFTSATGTSSFVVCAISVLTATSQFSWYDQVSIYGTMEVGSLIFLFIALRRLYDLLKDQDLPSTGQFAHPLLALTFSALTHERYTVAIMAVWAIILFRWRACPHVSRRASIFLMSPLAILLCRVFILNLNPYQGGGETASVSGSTLSLTKRFIRASVDIFGSIAGGGRYYAPGRFSDLMNGLGLSPLILLLTLPLLLGGAFAIAKTASKAKTFSDSEWIFMLLMVTGASLILIASTVAERTEGRWLYGPQILIILGLSTLLLRLDVRSRVLRRLPQLIVYTSLIGLIAIALYYRGSAYVYTSLQRQANQTLISLDKRDLPKQSWSLRVVQPDSSLPAEWQFAYGKAFKQLKSPPNVVTFSNVAGPCLMPIGTRVCVNLRLTDIRVVSEITTTQLKKF